MSTRPQSPAPTRDRTQSVPADLESTTAKLVYHSLDAAGDATVEDLVERLGLTRLTLLSVLGSLDDREYVTREGGRYRPA
jgi:DNA-binding MarR family transcriptional regulator